MLGACLDRVQGLEEISLCFEKADPKVGIDALMDALDECLLSKDVQLLDLTLLKPCGMVLPGDSVCWISSSPGSRSDPVVKCSKGWAYPLCASKT